MTLWRPKPGHILTPWGKAIQPEKVLPEYPRPQMRREAWLNLNGLWRFAITGRDAGVPREFPGEILVPFPIESALSGVMQPLFPDQLLWYRRTFRIPEAWLGQRILLHFGAVDWETHVWLNGDEIGSHRGGFIPFTFELTEYISTGENELIVSVWDPTDQHWQQRGKQSLAPKTIWYSAASGIWQTVWLEPVPEAYLEAFTLAPRFDDQELEVHLEVSGQGEAVAAKLRVRDGDHTIATVVGQADEIFGLKLPGFIPWNPEIPHLYDLIITLKDKNDNILDTVETYFGMRKFSLGKDKGGRTRFFLNNQPYFQYGPLDQGYWPDGLLTPPSDDALRFDIEQMKALGCNMIRKHIKVEPARYYYHCDRIGMIVWQDMINGAQAVGSLLSVLEIFFNLPLPDDLSYKRAGREEEESRQDFNRELNEMIAYLYNAVCIGMWVSFNEGWGQFDAYKTAEWVKKLDPTRLVDHASGWFDQGGGDFISQHVYFRKLKPKPPSEERAVILSEFGGYTLNLDEHVWNPEKVFGYRKFKTQEALTKGYVKLIEEQLIPWVEAGLSGAVYTQTTDVEIETNGYLTYDREVMKMDPAQVRAVHEKIFSAAGNQQIGQSGAKE